MQSNYPPTKNKFKKRVMAMKKTQKTMAILPVVPDGSPPCVCVDLPYGPESTGRREKLTEGQNTNIDIISW